MDDKLLEELKSVPILCVEDEDGIREVIVNTLSYYFNEVYEAKDGNEAFELYEYHQPKIILSDIEMANGNGIDFVKKVREKDLNTTIIMLTAHSSEEYLLNLINLNINHYIIKPLNHKKLLDALMKYLNKNNQSVVLYEDLILDMEKRELIYKNEHISLRKREKEFLMMLVEKKDSIVTYEEIEEKLWGHKDMTTYALKSFIKDLRAKLPVNIVKNVPQEGYSLI